MRRIIEVLTAAAPMAHKTRYLCASALTAVMLVIIAAPAGAQDYYGPYDYCVWSIYACGGLLKSSFRGTRLFRPYRRS